MSVVSYENPLLGVKMDYPETWHRQENVAGAVVSFSPVPDDSVSAPSLNLVVQDLSSNPLTLEDFTTVSLFQMDQMLPEVNDMNVQGYTLAGNAGKIVSYSTTLQDTKIKFTQVFTLKNDVAYIITFSSPLLIHEKFSAVVEQCMRSFRLIAKKGVGSVCLAPFLNKAYSYFIRVPKGWDRRELRSGAVQRFDSAPSSSTTTSASSSSGLLTLIVTIDYFPQDDLASFTRVMKAQIEQTSTEAPVAVQQASLAGLPANTASFYSHSARLPGRYRQIWAVQNQFAGVITLIHNIDQDEPDQDEFLPLFERVLESFSFVKPDHVLDPSLRYENLTLKFSINFPERFAPQEGFMGATVSFAVPDHIASQAFGTNINVVVQRMPNQAMTLDEFCTTIKQQLDSTVADIETHKEVAVSVAGFPGKESQYSGKIEKQAVRFVQRVAIANENAIVLSFAAERDKFEREFRTVGKYLDTFRFF